MNFNGCPINQGRARWRVFNSGREHQKGVVALFVVWVLTVLTLLALSLGRRTALETQLTSHEMGRIKARYYAWAGIAWARELISRRGKDTGERPWVFPARVHQIIGEGDFELRVQDESSRINLNGLSSRNVRVLVALLLAVGLDPPKAQTIAYAVLDWKDKDTRLAHADFGAENPFYENLEMPYRGKNAPLENMEELLLVKGVDAESYAKIKPYVTVYPRTGSLRVNFETAAPLVLKALANAFKDELHGETRHTVERLVAKMVAYRAGEDRQEGTPDDRVIERAALDLTRLQRNLFVRLAPYRLRVPGYFRVHVKGTDRDRNVSCRIKAVIRKRDLRLVAWERM